MSEGFGGIVDNKNLDKKPAVIIDDDEYNKIIKDYKRLKKYQKSTMYEVAKLSGKEPELDRLLKEYGDTNDLEQGQPTQINGDLLEDTPGKGSESD